MATALDDIPPAAAPRPADGPAPPREEPAEVVIRPRSGWVPIDWAELVRGRELLYFLAWRDVKVRYKQTALGAAWAVLQPLFTMIIFTVIFGRFAKITPPGGIPYAAFVFAGLLPWTFFAGAVGAAALSLVNQQHLLTKVYFPRLYVPASSVGVFLVDYAIGLALYAAILAATRVAPSPGAVLLPALMALLTAAALGLGTLLGALTVMYRDFRYVVPFLLQILMYASPVIYPLSMVRDARLRAVLALNPACGLIEACRSAVLGTPWDLPALAISAASTVLVLVLGLAYFRRAERHFADIA